MSIPDPITHDVQSDDSLPPPAEQFIVKRSRTRRRSLRFWTPEEILQWPDAEYLIRGVLVEGGFAAVCGKPADFKTFLALDWGLSIATGLSWAGREVRTGRVVYVAAEGVSGVGRRLAAWKQYHGVTVTDAHFLTQPIIFTDPVTLTDLITLIQDLPDSPVLIIIDTLARCFGQGDENSARDMGAFVAAIDDLREVIGCAVLLLHHEPYQGRKLRGSSALAGALDTIIAVERKGNRLELTCQKQKDAAEFGPIRLVAAEVTLDDGGTSLVLLPDGDENIARQPEVGVKDAEAEGNDRARLMLAQLAEFGSQGASATEWQEAGAAAGVPRATFFRTIKDLRASGCVEKFDAAGKPRYRVTEATAESEIGDLFVDDDDCDNSEW
jgi:AAA domain